MCSDRFSAALSSFLHQSDKFEACLFLFFIEFVNRAGSKGWRADRNSRFELFLFDKVRTGIACSEAQLFRANEYKYNRGVIIGELRWLSDFFHVAMRSEKN